MQTCRAGVNPSGVAQWHMHAALRLLPSQEHWVLELENWLLVPVLLLLPPDTLSAKGQQLEGCRYCKVTWCDETHLLSHFLRSTGMATGSCHAPSTSAAPTRRSRPNNAFPHELTCAGGHVGTEGPPVLDSIAVGVPAAVQSSEGRFESMHGMHGCSWSAETHPRCVHSRGHEACLAGCAAAVAFVDCSPRNKPHTAALVGKCNHCMMQLAAIGKPSAITPSSALGWQEGTGALPAVRLGTVWRPDSR
jgi:hypothetical protein